MVAGPNDFPLWSGRVEDPAEGDFDDWLDRFAAHQTVLGLDRAVIVHSILYGGDNAITLETVRRLGPDFARGIALVRDDVADAELDRLARAGISGVRLNYVHGGILSWDGVKALTPRLKARDLHIQMLLNTHRHMLEIAEDIRDMSVPVVIDHIGWPDLSLGVDEPGFAMLNQLLAEGHVWVKLSGAYRLCEAPYDRAAAAITRLIETNPDQCLWASDWPHLMLADAGLPDAGILLNQFLDLMGTEASEKVLVRNPETLYGFQPKD
jgi:predicted TIM-barrel fold metal-dependent hydrolase